MTDFKIRKGKPGDQVRLLDIENSVFSSDRLSPRSMRHHLSAKSSQLLVCETRGNIVGYALLALRKNSRHARLYSIAIDPALRQPGMGRALLQACETAAAKHKCADLRLEVREDNPRAIQLYLQSGYQQFGTHEDYYEDGARALRFEKVLTAN
jgi:ribosomal-protein-alanine acetyltransferase